MGQKKHERESQKHINPMKNENTTTPIVWDTAKAILHGKFMPLDKHIRKISNFKLKNLPPMSRMYLYQIH